MFHRVGVLTKVGFYSLVAVLVLALTGTQVLAQAIAPQLVPYNVTAIAGNTQSSVAGYGGEGVPGLSATLNGPNALAVDSVGNVYIADQANALIREWNPRTNVIKTIAGVLPSKCTGTTCTSINSGCSDGVSAYGNLVGSRMQGLVVDGFGNVYFSDYNYQGVWVIYRGGARVANFIALVDSGTVSSPSAVQPGYVYHIAGTATPKAGGCTASSGTTDNVLATTAKFHDPLQMGIDAAGNLYVQDFANNVVRAINTQGTTQNILGVTIQPGFVASVVGCNATMTTACPASVPPWGSPATGALYNVLAGMTADQYGNVYQVNTKGATGSIYGGVAYAGGAALAHLLNLESGLTPTAGGWYEVINNINSTYCTGYSDSPTCKVSAPLEPAVPANAADNIALRPDTIAVDPNGNVYMGDTHWLTIYRVDANSQMASRLLPGSGNTSQVAPAGTLAAPAFCSATATSGPQTYDAYGDGCSIQQAKMSSAGTGYITFDGAGNLYFSDTSNNIVRKVSVGNQFASTTLGASLSQTLQLHFDQSNLPNTQDVNSFKILGAGADFTLSSVNCSNYTIRDASVECYVTIAFAPKAVGTRIATLQASAAYGTYTFSLTGTGSGPAIAIDGGSQTILTVTGLATPTSATLASQGIAVDSQGNVYAADPANNRITMTPAGGGKTTVVGMGFSAPRGVAVDPAGNVYVTDTGNNRVVKVVGTGSSQTQTVLAAGLDSRAGLSSPTGITLDAAGNIYIADTGNARIVEIPAFGELAPVPMLSYSGSQTFVTPVGIAVDTIGNIYVADSGNSSGIIKIAPGGGDFQVAAGATSIASPTSVISFGSAPITKPTGVVVDSSGNLYVSDAGSNKVVELPTGSGPGSEPVVLGFTALNSPGGLALDSNNNVYLMDSGNSRVLYENRTQAALNFGTYARLEPASKLPLTVTNIGTAPITPASPFTTLTGATADFTESDTCAASNFPLGTLTNGLHCAITISFQPVVDGPLSGTLNVQGGAASVSLIGTGEDPLVTITEAVTAPAGGAVRDQPATITLTATQPNFPHPPTGTVTFNYTINGVAQTPVTANLTTTGSAATTTFTLPTLLAGRTYVINAVYNGDTYNSVTNADPFTISIPGLPVTAVSTSASFTYGGAVPALTGSVSGIMPADLAGITVTFTTSATPSTPVGTYPITAVLTGGNSASYTVSPAVTTSGTPAVVTENKAPLTLVVASFNEPYGFPDAPYTVQATGFVNGDTPAYTYTPAHSSLQPVGTYSIVPTVTIPTTGSTYNKFNNYTPQITNGTLVVVKATPIITVTQAAKAVLPTNVSGGTITIAVGAQPSSYGTPSGTLMVTDTFTPITPTGTGTVVTATPLTLTLTPTPVANASPTGVATYTPTSTTLGTHVYVFSYSGDSNFNVTDTSSTPTSLVVDQPDYTVASTTSPVLIIPGIIPGGNAAVAGEQAATPEIATVFIAPVLGSTAIVNLTCAVPSSYITCTLSPASVTMSGTTTQTSTVSISVPATLPLGYKTSSISRGLNGIAYALLPIGMLTALGLFRKRRKLSHMLLVSFSFVLLFAVSGCGGGNLVQFYTPVPAGPSSVVVTGTSGNITRSFTIPINIQ